jgi:ATP-dependent protease ClpP protease subunit
MGGQRRDPRLLGGTSRAAPLPAEYRDQWLSAQEAIDYGIVGRIVQGRDEL